MYDSISLDPNTSRLCQLDAAQWRQPITPNRCMYISKHQDEYLQIEHDNPNLIWLYTLMLEDQVELPHGEVISAMKQRLLEESSLTPLAWRFIANGTADDFRVVLDSHNLGEEPQWRWHTLLAWLQVLSGLRLNHPIPEPLQELFLHDGLVVEKVNDEVLFRGAWMRFNTLRYILEEAEKRLATGTFQQFSETEMVDVITWLAATDPDMDNNQICNGWNYLARTAAEWKSEITLMETYQKLKWESALPQVQVDNWVIEPVDDAWSLHRLAISQRHCGDRYVEGCLGGTERIFVIRNPEEKIVATLRITLVDDRWTVGDIRGSANSAVSAEIIELGEVVAKHYADLGR
jgi:hypothetical protein